MQFIRNSLSLSFQSQPTVDEQQSQQQQSQEQQQNGNGSKEVPTVPDKRNAGAKPWLSSPTASNSTDGSEKFSTAQRKRVTVAGTPPSAYSTPFQSPVIDIRQFPGENGQDDHNHNRSKEKVYVIGNSSYSAYNPKYPPSTPSTTGFVNPAFNNDSGATVINVSNTQPSVIREQYWTWSCKCRRELNNREKVLLLIIFFLILVIGGLAAYLGIVVDSDNSGFTGGILTDGA